MTKLRIVNRSALQGLVGALLVTAIIIAVLLAPALAPHGEVDLVGDVWAPIGSGAPLGLDNLGRDMLSRVLYGGRITLLITLGATGLSFVIGTVLGLVAALSGGWIDGVTTRLVDAVMAMPPLICALVLLSVLGTSVPLLIMTIAVLASTRVFRLSHSLTGGIMALDFFEAARLRGERLPWLACREVLPNILPPLVTEFGLRLCSNFLLVASLSFLGLGVQPPLADWGSMVRENASAISFGILAPLIPAAAIALFAIGVNLVVDWSLALQSRQQD
ncbi:MAG: ABC transporter permease [Acetobacteraceae bacterium]